MIVEISRKQLRCFRDQARESKDEVFAYLVGGGCPKRRVRVSRFEYPQVARATPGSVEVGGAERERIKEAAAAERLRVVGFIHSHPDGPSYLSATDYRAHVKNGYLVTGVVEVLGRRTRVTFWRDGSPLPVEIKYTED